MLTLTLRGWLQAPWPRLHWKTPELLQTVAEAASRHTPGSSRHADSWLLGCLPVLVVGMLMVCKVQATMAVLG